MNCQKNTASDAKGALADAVINSLITEGTETDFDLIINMYNAAPFGQEKIGMRCSAGRLPCKSE